MLRARSGFDINQLAAEYRALRASVLQLCLNACEADGINLDDVVRLLVGNAINYEAADTPIHVVLTGDEADVTVEVKNTGPTIEKEILNHIFDPLKRGLSQDNRDENGAGLGLGLYIVREVGRAHGGEVTVQSDNGETVFAVRLPRRN